MKEEIVADGNASCPNCQQLKLELDAAIEMIANLKSGRPTFIEPPGWRRDYDYLGYDFWASMRFNSKFVNTLRQGKTGSDKFFRRIFNNLGLGTPDESYNPLGLK